MNSDSQVHNKSSENWYPLIRKIIIIAMAFAIILSILMIANYIQTTSIEPLNNKALNQLMLQLQKDPDNQVLKEQIRALDLLARKAYFTNLWQIRTGGFLLFAAIIILLLSLKFLNARKDKFPDLETTPSPNMSWDEKIMARKSIVYSGITIFGLALIAGLLTQSNLSSADDNENSSAGTLSQEQIRNNWNSFRGPGGLGIAYQENIPTHWDGKSGDNILWKTEISTSGYNSPIVWEDKIFFSSANKSTQEVYCLSSETGEILWKTELNNIPGTPSKKPKVTKDTGYAAPTMTTDGKNVYVIYATGDLAALNFKGEQIWAMNIGVPDNHYGHSSSLILYNNILIIQFDHNDGQFLIGLRASNGDEVYKTARADVQISWASPALIETSDGPQVVLNSSPYVVSYNPLNGQELWRVDCMYGEVGPSIAFGNETVFAVNDMAILAAIEPGDEPKIIWEYDEDLSEASSPVATEDYLFLASGIGIISCFDVKTGEQYWFHEFDEGFYSSPIVVGELVYIIDKKGVAHIIKADKNFELVSQPVLGEDVVATPAFMPGRIYIRSNNHMYCIGNKDG